MASILVVALALLAALAVERVRLDGARAAVPLRIAVTGTRGKTSVARLLASVLREDGRTVLAKTTGSEPRLVLPDGTEEAVARRGPASILEQKRLLHRAVRMGADAVVAEAMSIHAENHAVEGRSILIPHLVLATNFHVDHVEAQGDSPESVGAVLGLAVPPGAAVLVHAGSAPSTFRSAVAAVGATLEEVEAGPAPGDGPGAFAHENARLVVAAARHLGVGDDAIRRGISRARFDVGATRAWRVSGPAPAFLVHAFAANDPASTLRVLDEVTAGLDDAFGGPAGTGSPDARPRRVGLLSLRADRGDRTLQWADALGAGLLDRFDSLLVTGMHARALSRRVLRMRGSTPPPPRILLMGSTDPADLTRTALAELGHQGGLVLGFGNIGGAGLALVDHWTRVGQEEPLGL